MFKIIYMACHIAAGSCGILEIDGVEASSREECMKIAEEFTPQLPEYGFVPMEGPQCVEEKPEKKPGIDA